MKLRFAIIIVIYLLLYSCTNVENHKVSYSNGIEVIHNGNYVTSNQPNYDLSYVGVIESDSMNIFKFITSVKEDACGNIYITDMYNYKISKYDSDLNYLRSIGQYGQGPGEFNIIEDCFVHNDSLYIPDIDRLKLIKYSLDGEFDSDKAYTSVKFFPIQAIQFRDGFISRKTDRLENENGQYYLVYGINLYDYKLNYIKTFRYERKFRTYEENPNHPVNTEDNIFSFCTIGDRIYIADNNENHYKINVYNNNFENVQTINRNYKRQKYSDCSQEKLEKIAEELEFKFKAEYHKAIYDIKPDKYENLWVKTPSAENKTKSGYIYDIYRDGILIAKYDILESVYETIICIGDKIYVHDENLRNIKVFEYSTKPPSPTTFKQFN